MNKRSIQNKKYDFWAIITHDYKEFKSYQIQLDVVFTCIRVCTQIIIYDWYKKEININIVLTESLFCQVSITKSVCWWNAWYWIFDAFVRFRGRLLKNNFSICWAKHTTRMIIDWNCWFHYPLGSVVLVYFSQDNWLR